MSAALADRDKCDPVGLFTRVATAYVADRVGSGKTPSLRYFCQDFEEWAGKVGESTPADPTIAEWREAHAAVKAAEKRGASEDELAPLLERLKAVS